MSPWIASDMKMIALKAAAGDGTTVAVKIPVRGGEGVDLGGVGHALGLEPSSIRLNGYFVSRGADLVSSLPWDSLLSYFAPRGLPAGGSLLDSIVVQGKPITHTAFKRKVAVMKTLKKRIDCLKGKVGECNSDWHSSSNGKNVGHLGFKRKSIIDDGTLPKKNRLLEGSSIEQNFSTVQDTENDFLCIKRRLKLDDDYPTKKGKIDECNSGLLDEASKLPMVSAKTGYNNCSITNVFGKRVREDDAALTGVFCKRIK